MARLTILPHLTLQPSRRPRNHRKLLNAPRPVLQGKFKRWSHLRCHSLTWKTWTHLQKQSYLHREAWKLINRSCSSKGAKIRCSLRRCDPVRTEANFPSYLTRRDLKPHSPLASRGKATKAPHELSQCSHRSAAQAKSLEIIIQSPSEAPTECNQTRKVTDQQPCLCNKTRPKKYNRLTESINQVTIITWLWHLQEFHINRFSKTVKRLLHQWSYLLWPITR